jgi:hypothetical protein
VRVTQARDDVGQLEVKPVVGQDAGLAAKDPQPLNRIEPVTRPLERKVRVHAFDQPFHAVDETAAFGVGQRPGREERADERTGRERSGRPSGGPGRARPSRTASASTSPWRSDGVGETDSALPGRDATLAMSILLGRYQLGALL